MGVLTDRLAMSAHTPEDFALVFQRGCLQPRVPELAVDVERLVQSGQGRFRFALCPLELTAVAQHRALLFPSVYLSGELERAREIAPGPGRIAANEPAAEALEELNLLCREAARADASPSRSTCSPSSRSGLRTMYSLRASRSFCRPTNLCEMPRAWFVNSWPHFGRRSPIALSSRLRPSSGSSANVITLVA